MRAILQLGVVSALLLCSLAISPCRIESPSNLSGSLHGALSLHCQLKGKSCNDIHDLVVYTRTFAHYPLSVCSALSSPRGLQQLLGELNWDSDCFQRVSQCGSLGFHYLNATVHSVSSKCPSREILLLLELQHTEWENGDSMHLEACIDGMSKYHFWNYLACSTITEGGGSEVDFISCKPNEILPPDDPSTTVHVLPTWVSVVLTILVVMVVIAVLATCVTAYQYYHYRTGRTTAQERPGDSPRVVGESYASNSIDGANLAQSQHFSLSQWLRDKRLVPHNWSRPTAHTHPVAIDVMQDSGTPKLGSGSYQSIDDESDPSPAHSHHFSLSQWLREKGLVPHNWFRPTARTSAVYCERQQPQGASTRSSTLQCAEA